MKHKRAWDGGEWQSFALQLVQHRHGHQNIQCVPDKVAGDAGIEFIFTGGTLYQCYAPAETSDVAKAAEAQKAKATKDLKKLVTYKDKLIPLLKGLSIDRWILLCPFLDNKEVVAHVRSKAIALRSENLPFLSNQFEGLVHSQEDFAAEIELLRQQSMLPMKIDLSPAMDISAAQGGEIGQKITEKLTRGFEAIETPEKIAARRDTYIRNHLSRENALENLRQNHPALWERSIQCLSAEEQRLAAVGASSSLPGDQLKESVARIEAALSKDLPDMPGAFATTVAIGTVGEWLMRCPLDFPEANK
ncbi:hypothetical protein [Caulobacter mirabilis]|uniref:Uncharacterized protein n=1 Tax=Caulobacter mirabilis TaxID=69666 RepID=A0A2D2AYL9_9CAUL|nr:hypothetical protein [Caulobacter mirabilis]ATQ43116.1 hypothetical protein CSW64_12175 [Caulobacter mirabilis]